jgi:hypothetical protein
LYNKEIEFWKGYVLIVVDNCSEEDPFIESQKEDHNSIVDEDATPGQSETRSISYRATEYHCQEQSQNIHPGLEFQGMIEGCSISIGLLSLFCYFRHIENERQKLIDICGGIMRPRSTRTQNAIHISIHGLLES